MESEKYKCLAKALETGGLKLEPIKPDTDAVVDQPFADMITKEAVETPLDVAKFQFEGPDGSQNHLMVTERPDYKTFGFERVPKDSPEASPSIQGAIDNNEQHFNTINFRKSPDSARKMIKQIFNCRDALTS